MLNDKETWKGDGYQTVTVFDLWLESVNSQVLSRTPCMPDASSLPTYLPRCLISYRTAIPLASTDGILDFTKFFVYYSF